MSFEFEFTQDKLAQIIPQAKYGVQVWYDEMAELLPLFEITTAERVAAFIAQTAHESGGYTALVENLNYSAEALNRVWPRRFPTIEFAKQFARNPIKIANTVYSNRMGNGAPETGDGFLYRGRGLIQLTGKTNYSLFAEYAEIPVQDAPGYIETPRGAIHSACWFWHTNNLNGYADAGEFTAMTRIINGGTNGLQDRIQHYNHALELFS